MKKVWFIIGIALVLTTSYIIPLATPKSVNAQNEGIPSYAKWGRLAMEETRVKYPNAQIIDYLHIGKEIKGDAEIEKFKLWLKGTEKEFGVFINIEYNPKTDEVLKITYKETDR